jgi:asparagine synthase (glutamine-hydrolysing)
MGFAVPLASWFRGPLRSAVEERLTHGKILECGMFDNGRIERIVEQHMRGTRDQSAPIWALLVFANFLHANS